MRSDDPLRVIFVRHGERLDEADRLRWMQECTNDNWHDPPLTESGHMQARKAGEALRQKVGGVRTQLFSSPSARTLSTAARVAAELGINHINVSLGLYACAAAAARGKLEHLKLREPQHEDYPDLVKGCSVKYHGCTSHSYMQGVEVAISQAAEDCDTLIIVTHREGIRDLAGAVRQRVHTRYCSAFEFLFHGGEEWSFGGVVHEGE